jgi:hypothetical protein
MVSSLGGEHKFQIFEGKNLAMCDSDDGSKQSYFGSHRSLVIARLVK